MRLAIIGAGNVGSALASSAVGAGHEVTISSDDPGDAERLAGELGANAASDNVSAVANAEIAILAVPFPALEELAKELKPALGDGRVVVDVTNRLDPEDPAAMIDGSSAAETLQGWLPDASVVKAFNTAFAARQADPEVNGMRSDGFVAGDGDAKRKVLDLVESMGFQPVDAGPLGMARALEAMATLNISRQIREDGAWQAAWKLVEPQ